MPKHLGLYLDGKLNFHDHINVKILNANKEIETIKRLSNTLPRNSLWTIYKSFIRTRLDHCDIIYDQLNNKSFRTNIEHISYTFLIQWKNQKTTHSWRERHALTLYSLYTVFSSLLSISSMVSQLRMRSLFKQDVIKNC